VEDRSAAGIGHERGASVLIVPKLTGTKHNTLTIELVATQSGELLGDVAVEAGGDDQDLLVDAASGRLEELIAPLSRSTEQRSAGSPNAAFRP
jgi:hypothetical protein